MEKQLTLKYKQESVQYDLVEVKNVRCSRKEPQYLT